jgi:hypothetical protein
MSRSILSRTRKKIGRPSTGAESVHLRVLPDQAAAIDAWIKRQKEPISRPEAIRRLVELGLTIKTKAKQPSAARAVRAKELATKAIDKIINPSAPPEERAQRRRRLTKGPSEFREDRVDLPAKGK